MLPHIVDWMQEATDRDSCIRALQLLSLSACTCHVATPDSTTVTWVMQGLPEGHTEACYPVMRPGVDSHRAPPLKDSDADKREVCSSQHLCLSTIMLQEPLLGQGHTNCELLD